jgi:hypothetical protein
MAIMKIIAIYRKRDVGRSEKPKTYHALNSKQEFMSSYFLAYRCYK